MKIFNVFSPGNPALNVELHTSYGVRDTGITSTSTSIYFHVHY